MPALTRPCGLPPSEACLFCQHAAIARPGPSHTPSPHGLQLPASLSADKRDLASRLTIAVTLFLSLTAVNFVLL